ncbi:hypothetical protein GGI01_003611 [Coemansia sp. RSA 376]|nr:hypothetical protein GGI01_003611 [Coemansia sp. RSA 376]
MTPACTSANTNESPAGTPTRRNADFVVDDHHGYSSPQGIHSCYFGASAFDAVHANCDAVLKIASPFDPDTRSMSDRLSSMIATDLEARLSKLANDGENCADYSEMACPSYPQDRGRGTDPLDAWALTVLEWSSCSAPTASDASQNSSDSKCSDDSESCFLKAYLIAPSFEALILFVAHHIKVYFSEQVTAGHLRSDDYRLILPIANEDTETDCTYFYCADHEDPYTMARVECGMFPLSGSSVERQKAPVPRYIVADAEIAADKYGLGGAVQRLDTKTRELYYNQHNRMFAWGLTIACRTICAHVFGLDDIWVSTAMDISREKGRQAFITLLVDWSLCSTDSLRLDPSIRYALSDNVDNCCLEIDVYEVDESTSQVERRTYYSKECIGGAESLIGPRTRYFAAAPCLELIDMPTLLIKDLWIPMNGNCADDMHDGRLALDVIHKNFGNSSEFSGSFPQLVSAGPVYINRGRELVEDTTTTAFAGLPGISKVRQHRRIVTKWAGKMISTATYEDQVILAIADAMTAYNVVYEKCKVLHGNITDRAILFKESADGVTGMLAEFDYATLLSDTGDIGDTCGAVDTGTTVEPELPELSMFWPIHRLEGAVVPHTRLGDCESLLYLVCVLGTFGINKAEQEKFAKVEKERHARCQPKALRIKEWNTGAAEDIALIKRNHLDTMNTFDSLILSKMKQHPSLCDLAADIYDVLFQHPRCSGACLKRIPILRGHSGGVVGEPLERDPLVLRHPFEAEIVANLLKVLEDHKQRAIKACAVREANAATAAEVARGAAVATPSPTPAPEPSSAAGPSGRRRRVEIPLTGPAASTRSKTSHQSHNA